MYAHYVTLRGGGGEGLKLKVEYNQMKLRGTPILGSAAGSSPPTFSYELFSMNACRNGEDGTLFGSSQARNHQSGCFTQYISAPQYRPCICICTMAKKCTQDARFLRIVLGIVHPIPKVSLVTIGRPCFCADVAPCLVCFAHSERFET
jgi:hypothetical protein